MKHFTIETKHHRLHATKWICHDAERILILIHGLGEYADRYDTTARMFNEAKFSVYSFDMPGHGRTDGIRGNIGSRKQIMHDIDYVVNYVHSIYPDKNIYIYGHSMGGNIGLAYRMYCPNSYVKGYIISAPWIRLRRKPSILKIFTMKTLSIIIPNKKIIAFKVSNDMASDYIRDEYIHSYITIRTAMSRFYDGGLILKNSHIKSAPVFMFHGNRDNVCSIEASRDFAANAGSLCRFIEIENVGHECMHCNEYIDIMSEAINFCKSIK